MRSERRASSSPRGGNARFPRWVFVVSWAAVAAWAVLIFCMSANTGADLTDGDGIASLVFRFINDTVESLVGADIDLASPIGHFGEYAVFGALLANALRLMLPLRRACTLAVAIASAYGVTDELHQWFVPGRATDPADWAIDTLAAAFGSVVAGCLCCVAARRRR